MYCIVFNSFDMCCHDNVHNRTYIGHRTGNRVAKPLFRLIIIITSSINIFNVFIISTSNVLYYRVRVDHQMVPIISSSGWMNVMEEDTGRTDDAEWGDQLHTFDS